MLGMYIGYFPHSCDQVTYKKQLQEGRLSFSPGFEYHIRVKGAWMAAGNWWQQHKAACSHLGQSGIGSRAGL